MRPGDLIGPVEIGPVAHGGHCVARLDGRVVFVRHVLPGELVTARVTEVAKRFARADAAEVLRASPERVEPPCAAAGECGGCDFQHVRPRFQAELKRRVLAEQLRRLAGLEWSGAVEQVAPVTGSRVRMRFVTDDEGKLGLRAHRSHRVVPLPGGRCAIADPAMPLEPPPAEPGTEWLGLVGDSGGALVSPDAGGVVAESVGGRRFEVSTDGFWQAHVRAPEVLTRAVLDGVRPAAGERASDLYCGVGVFAGALADAGCRVWGIEGNRDAVGRARTNVPEARFFAGSVDRTLRRLPARADLVVLDPPRAGAGRTVMAAVAQLRPRAVAYVACDPAALARDLGFARDHGLEVESIRAFDLFGMTHHLEAVAILHPVH